MGTYLPTPKRRRRSVADALLEAEHEHLLDCPNADLPMRSAALLLDLILFSLASSGIRQFMEAIKNAALALVGPLSEPAAPAVILGVLYLAWLLKTAALFLYFVWSQMRFGGSPAKLIMGMRVVDAETGERLEHRQALIREVTKAILGLVGGALALTRADRRTFHDLVSGTSVKRVRGP